MRSQQTRRLLMVRAIVTMALLGAVNSIAFAQPPKLSKRIQFALQAEIMPAFRNGDAVTLVSKLSPLLGRVSLDERITIDDLLDQQGLPSSGEMLTQMRMKLIRFGAEASVPPPKGRELRMLLSHLDEQINATLSLLAASHAAMADLIPELSTFREFEEMFWSIHVLQNELLNAHATARTAVAIRAAQVREEDLAAVPNFDAQVNAVKEFAQELKERQLELRLKRLLFADRSLARSSDLKERIPAAYAADFDSEVLLAFLAERKKLGEGAIALRRPALAVEDLEETVRRTRESASAQAGDLTEKSRLFFVGLHWWFRGRYGQGAEQGGLLKSPLATQSREALVALMMPQQTPKPADSTQGGLRRTPKYDRRHHYTWSTIQPRFVTTSTYFH